MLPALGLNAAIAAAAWRARALDTAGAASTVVIGTAITAGLGLGGLAVMATFFVAGTAATRLGHARKARARHRAGARRRARLAERLGERRRSGRARRAARRWLRAGARGLWVLAYVAAVATAAADTCASEVGKAYGRRTVALTTLRPVPPGTEGGVSLEGTLGGLAGAALVASPGPRSASTPGRPRSWRAPRDWRAASSKA